VALNDPYLLSWLLSREPKKLPLCVRETAIGTTAPEKPYLGEPDRVDGHS
jgi:hypothetical protein